jgi:hypothetical protein
MHAKDLAFEDHYPVDKTIEIGTPHPRVTTNTPKENVGFSGDHEM